MKESGRIIEAYNDKVKVMIRRNTACESCGACHFGEDKLNMILETDNSINANVGDEVIIDLNTNNFFLATIIIYGIPLIALIIGIFSGYYFSLLLGKTIDFAQAVSAISGISLLFLSYVFIKNKEHKFKDMNEFKPKIIKIQNRQGKESDYE